MTTAEHSSDAQAPRRELLLVLILAGVQFSHIMDFVIMMPLGPQLMRVFGIAPKQFGLVVSVYTLSASVSCFLAALFMDRFDRKRVLVSIYAGLVIGTFLCGLAPTFSALVAARVVTGIFGGLLQAVILSIIGDVVHPSRRGQATGMVMAAFAVASVVGVPIGLSIANHFGWQMTFILLAVVSALNFILAVRFLPPIREHLARPQVAAGVLTDMVRLLSLRATCVSAFLVTVVGITEGDLPTVYMFAGVASFFISPTIGRLSDRWGARRIFVSSSIVAIPAIILFSLLKQASLVMAISLNTLVAAVGAARMTPSLTLINSSVTSERRGRFMTLIASVQQLFAAVASYGGGMILGEGSAGLDRFPVLGAIVAASMLLSSLLSFLIKPVA
ncbi:MAG: MFS transporter [Proteobacteria bacterium]|nr:MFS transporter [Pseudomonadota bacterium]